MAILNRLPTQDRLSSFGMQVETGCVLCGREHEWRDHIFFDCAFSRKVWFGILLPCQLRRDWGGQPADGWAGPQATCMCIRHTIEAAPTARVDGVMPLGFVTERTEGGDSICARTRLIWPGRDRVKCRTAQRPSEPRAEAVTSGIRARMVERFEATNNGVTGSKLAILEEPPVWGSDRRQNGGAPRPGLRCFLCQGHHRVAECPQRSALTTLRTTAQDPKQVDAPSNNADEGLARVGSIRFLYALQSKQDARKTEKGSGLMYVDMELNGVASKAFIDIGATDTFICPEEAERCNLKLTRGVGRVKAVNSATSVIWGNAKDVKTKIGSWEGNVSYTVLPMDDFDIVLGQDFMIANQVVPIPATGCLMFQGCLPGVVAALIRHKSPKKSLATIQVSQGVQESVVDEDVDKLGGGQPADGWAGPQATDMCIRHTIEVAPTARVDGGPLWASGMPYDLGFWLDGQDDGLRLTDCFLVCGQICSRTRLTLSRRGLTSAAQLCDRANRGRR
ncbi:hypothetical protein GQ457_17G017510 [Hibiscus cannabinus]